LSSSSPSLPATSAPNAKPPVTHEAIDATQCGPAMKAALHAVLDGVPYRDAAREVGLASHQDLHRAAKRLGLLEVHTKQLVAQCQRLADLSSSELERRLVEDPGSIGTKDLSVINGIALDKVANYEGWRHRNHDAASLASQAVDRLAALEGKLTMSVVVERTPPVEREVTGTLSQAPVELLVREVGDDYVAIPAPGAVRAPPTPAEPAPG